MSSYDKVFKVGRTIGRLGGKYRRTLNRVSNQVWTNNQDTTAISPVGQPNGVIAGNGEFGALCALEDSHGGMYAACLVGGKNPGFKIGIFGAVIDYDFPLLGEYVQSRYGVVDRYMLK
jgi:hypothetical protein